MAQVDLNAPVWAKTTLAFDTEEVCCFVEASGDRAELIEFRQGVCSLAKNRIAHSLGLVATAACARRAALRAPTLPAPPHVKV